MECIYCGEKNVKEVGKGLFRCYRCGQYFTLKKPYNITALSRSEVAERATYNLPIKIKEIPEAIVPRESDFVEFLQIMNDIGGGPTTIEDFVKMPEDMRDYYLRAYKIWKDKYGKGSKIGDKLKKYVEV